MKKIIRLFLPLTLGICISLFSNTENFKMIEKPFLTPPSFIFPIVWTILFILMGIFYMKYRENSDNKDLIIPYYIQLVLNLSWTIIFFNLKWYLFATLINLFIIIDVIYIMYKLIKDKNKLYYLWIPYLVWLLFALYICIGVLILN